jgi:hypothetical protein
MPKSQEGEKYRATHNGIVKNNPPPQTPSIFRKYAPGSEQV